MIKSFRGSLSTITSLALSWFVLELGRPLLRSTHPSLKLCEDWEKIDKLSRRFLYRCPDFRFIIRTGELYNRDEFQAQAKERLPLIVGGAVHSETPLAVDKYWS